MDYEKIVKEIDNVSWYGGITPSEIIERACLEAQLEALKGIVFDPNGLWLETITEIETKLKAMKWPQSCPKCAEKDAEIAKINGFRETTKAKLRTKSDQVAEILNQRNQLLDINGQLKAEIARLKKAILGSDEFEEKIQIVATELSDELRTERDELIAKLETARNALETITKPIPMHFSGTTSGHCHKTAKDALKQIGES